MEEKMEASKEEKAQLIRTSEETVCTNQVECKKRIKELQEAFEKENIAVYEAKMDRLQREKQEGLEKLWQASALKMHVDLKHFKSESSLENESHPVIHSLKAEYESKIDDLRLLLAKGHNAEVDRMMC